jgi:hypothetical protein
VVFNSFLECPRSWIEEPLNFVVADGTRIEMLFSAIEEPFLKLNKDLFE